MSNDNHNNKMDNTFEEFMTSSMGINGIINRIKNKAIMKGYQYIKNSIGFEQVIVDQQVFKQIAEYFNKICGVNIFPDKNKFHKSELFPRVCIDKFFKLDINTFVYISWDKGDIGNNTYPEGYMYIFGKKSYKHYNYIYNNIIDAVNHGINNSTIVYTIYANPDRDDWQGIRKSIPSRPFNTLYFNDDIEEKIKNHIDNWLKNKDTYRSRGITFKTGILLYGSPGTGKSSIAAAVADYMNCNIILIDSASFKNLNINEVTASINADDRMYVVLLDDIDVILTNREDEKATIDDKATISKLLGFLDSSNSPDNVIFIATTNHIKLFDKAITRSGRFDKVIEIDNISRSTALRMCEGFGLSKEDADKVVSEMCCNKDSDKSINPADLQVKILETIKTNMINSES